VDLESSNIRHNNEFYNNNLYHQTDTFKQTNTFEESNNGFESDIKFKENQYNDLKNNDNSNNELDKKSETNSVNNCLSVESNEEMDFSLKTTIAHLRGDLVYSIGVFISAVIINIRPDWRFFDSICTFLFSYVALELTIPIFNESIRILLEGSAEGMS